MGTKDADDRWFNGTRYRIHGTGDPLVLIHGVGLTIEHWDALVPLLAPHARVVVYDAAGHGRSDPPPAYDMGAFVRQLEGLLGHLGIRRCDILGYSMGALIAEGYALRHPDAVRRLILLSGVYDRTPEERSAVLDRIEQSRKEGYSGYLASLPVALNRYLTPAFRERRPDVVKELMERLEKNDLESFLSAYAFFGTADAELTADLHRITCPTLVVTGEDDPRSTATMSRKLAQRLPNARLSILAGLRHMPTLEAPDTLATLFVEFLSHANDLQRSPR